MVFGAEDGFTSARKVRGWCKRLQQGRRSGAAGGGGNGGGGGGGVGGEPVGGVSRGGGSEFTMWEASGTGHFWKEAGAARELVGAVKGWVESTLGDVEHES